VLVVAIPHGHLPILLGGSCLITALVNALSGKESHQLKQLERHGEGLIKGKAISDNMDLALNRVP